MNDITLGPMVTFDSQKQMRDICRSLCIEENYAPILILRSGDYYESLKAQLRPDQQKTVQGVIITIAFLKLFPA